MDALVVCSECERVLGSGDLVRFMGGRLPLGAVEGLVREALATWDQSLWAQALDDESGMLSPREVACELDAPGPVIVALARVGALPSFDVRLGAGLPLVPLSFIRHLLALARADWPGFLQRAEARMAWQSEREVAP